jgi:hypothetical protein
MGQKFNITESERKEIMEQHMSHGYKKPLNENFVHNSRLNQDPKYQVGDLVMLTFSNDGGWSRKSIPYKGTIMSIEKEVGINNNEEYKYEVKIEGGINDADDSMYDMRNFKHQPGDLVKVREHTIHKKY